MTKKPIGWLHDCGTQARSPLAGRALPGANIQSDMPISLNIGSTYNDEASQRVDFHSKTKHEYLKT